MTIFRTSRRRGIAPLVFLVSMIGAPSCKRASDRAPVGLAVQLSGCRDAGVTTCELNDERIVRVFAEPAEVQVFAVGPKGRTEITAQRLSVRGGVRLTLRVPDDAGSLDFVAGTRGARISLSRTPVPEWSRRAQQARRAGDLDGALAECASRFESRDAQERALAFGIAARVALARSDVATSARHFEMAIEAHRGAGGNPAALADDVFAFSFVLGQRGHRYAEARALLASLRDAELGAESRARAAYYRGILAEETGDVRAALPELAAAELAAERLGLARLGRNARQALALLHVRLADADAAGQLLQQVTRDLESRDDVGACEATELAINVSYMEMSRAARSLLPTEARARLEGVFVDGACRDLHLRRVAAGNLALLAYQEHELEAARRWLERATSVQEGDVADNAEHLFQLDLLARVELDAGHVDAALRGFDDVLRRARASALREAQWSALTGKAETLDRAHRVSEALVVYQEAEALLDAVGLAVPLGEGRAAYLDAHERSARSFCALLLRAKRPAEAARVARRSTRRAIASAELEPRIATLGPAERLRWEEAMGRYRAERAALDHAAADDWRAPLDALATRTQEREAVEKQLGRALDEALSHIYARSLVPDDAAGPPAAGVLRLTWVGGAEGPVVVLEHGAHARVHALPPEENAPLAEFAVDTASLPGGPLERVELFPTGRYGQQPLHAAQLGGRSLLAWAPVTYPLLRGYEPDGARPVTPREVLDVADPTMDLPAAAREAEHAAAAFRGRGWRVSVLAADAATHDAVLSALQHSDFLYYAGHGEYRGADGAGSRLRLAQGGALTVGDILALPRVPAHAIFSSCDSGRNAAEEAVVGLGVAAAWLTRGGQAVIAAPVPVPDQESEQLMQAVVGALGMQQGGPDLPSALREAQRGLPSAAGAAWAYRALVQ